MITKGCGSKSVYFQFRVYFKKYTDLLPHPLCFETGTHPPFRPMSQNTQFFLGLPLANNLLNWQFLGYPAYGQLIASY